MSEPKAEMTSRHVPLQMTVEMRRRGVRSEDIHAQRSYWAPEVSRFDCCAYIGELDLMRDRESPHSYMLVGSAERAMEVGNRFNYTRMNVRLDGSLFFHDNDVAPTPYELCLIYPALQEHLLEIFQPREVTPCQATK